MASVSLTLIRREFPWDALMVLLAIAQAAVFLEIPSAPVIALGVWWNSNTISHNFIHRPFFESRAGNRLFGAYLSVLLGIPQALWRERHLAHHANVRPRLRLSAELAAQTALVVALWIAMGLRSPRFLFSVYLPGYLAGLVLCALHGYYEHARGTTSHYGALYNLLCFNDGYHAEHHANPAVQWIRLPKRREAGARASRWPAPLRWVENLSLEGLERLVLLSPTLQRFVLRAHARAFRTLAATLPPVGRLAIVGGGLFPRTALILRQLLPGARIAIIDADRANLEQARAFLKMRGALDSAEAEDAAEGIEFLLGHYAPSGDWRFDLLVIPLAFVGDRDAIYANPPAPAVIVHDWIWRRRGASRMVSLFLLKRLNLVRR
jgi:hypothetical protein